MSKQRPAIVQVSKFVNASDKKYAGYINYMGRTEAQRSKYFGEYNALSFDRYQQYMHNPSKSSGLFSSGYGYLDKKGKGQYREWFKEAQENKSPMWQDVYSFDNQDLIEWGIYNPTTKSLNEAIIMDATRVAMDEKIKLMNLGDTAKWTASIHFNTDNIHVHVGMVEVQPTRPKVTYKGEEMYRGAVPKSTLDKVKSKFINHIVDRNQELAMLDHLIRKELAGSLGKQGQLKDLMLRKEMVHLINTLPPDLRKWQYGRKEMAPYRQAIDHISESFLKEKKGTELQMLNKALDNEMHFRKNLYGEGTKEFERFKDYKANKMKELYSTMGNTILKELKAIRRTIDHEQGYKYSPPIVTASDTKTGSIGSEADKERIKLEGLMEPGLSKIEKATPLSIDIPKTWQLPATDNRPMPISQKDMERAYRRREEAPVTTQKDWKQQMAAYSQINQTNPTVFHQGHVSQIRRALRKDIQHFYSKLDFERMEDERVWRKKQFEQAQQNGRSY
ncbi:MobP2 family relaxase [Listeria riparia]|uniref:Uncharacterized protein n=1 Tax=Listeria riparia FSL S10-1204 TaxID=1265816 RepID=W7CT89_9LIST|nr:MobP2 family relaxase [Listeria riparia]EUJ42869.1 hypothetical protein PRIP_15087 [Listeria riparia FSL S10-1204]